jgi:uncharacterized protein (TIGR03000 family)
LFSGGCHGGGRGCHGGGLFSGRHGCNGGCNGGYSCCGCTGGYSGCYGGCTGGYGCTGCIGGTVVPAKPELKEMPKPKDEEISAPATLVVTLPANAKLSIDDTVTTPKDVTTRVFETPALVGGREFSYTLKAEFVHEGKPVVVSKKVAVRAGAETAVSLGISDLAGVAAR